MMRTRTRGSLDGVQTYTTVTQNGQQTDYEQDISGVKVGEIQTTYDKVTPHFHQRIARGEVINNPFSSVLKRQDNTLKGAHIEDTWAFGTSIRHYVWSHGFLVPSPWGYALSFEQQLSEACTEAAARVENTTVDGSVEAAEARQTMSLFHVRNLALQDQLRRELAYAKRKGFRFPGPAVGAAVMANNWLMYRYGISPAVKLMNDALVVGSRIRTRRETARGSADTGGSVVEYGVPYTGGFNISFTPKRTMDWRVAVRAGILYEYRDFGNKYGFTLATVPRTIWEATPWSFVADWWVNAGDFISALTPRYHSFRLATWHGYELIVNSIYEPNWSWDGGGGRFTMHKAQSGDVLVHDETRYRLPYIRDPSLFVRENALKEILTSPRIVDAFALSTQLFFRLMSKVR